jgi:hypothetical protein
MSLSFKKIVKNPKDGIIARKLNKIFRLVKMSIRFRFNYIKLHLEYFTENAFKINMLHA